MKSFVPGHGLKKGTCIKFENGLIGIVFCHRRIVVLYLAVLTINIVPTTFNYYICFLALVLESDGSHCSS